MKQDNILSMLGLAKKAGQVVSGEFATEKAVKERKAKLVIIAEDASANTKKLFTNKCTYYEIPFYVYGNKVALGAHIGTEMRTSVAVLDEGFANSLIKKISASTEEQ